MFLTNVSCRLYDCFPHLYIIPLRTYVKNYFGCPFKLKGKMIDKLIESSEKRFQKALKPSNIFQTKRVHKQLDDSDNVKQINRKDKMNKLYFDAITLILATHEIGKNIRKYEVCITEVFMHQGYDSMSIYFSCKNEIIDEVFKEFVRIKGDLHKMLAEHYIQNSLPKIHFIYDSHTLLMARLHEILEKADYGPNYKPKQPNEFTPPIPDPDPSSKKKPLRSPHIWSLANFDEDYASSCKRNPYEPSVKPSAIFECPNDMKLDVLGLNYRSLVNQIELNIKKSRASLREYNAIADPLPPLDWFYHIPRKPPNPNDSASHYEERLKAMKTFISLNKKKKQILAREARKLKLCNEEEIYERNLWIKMKSDLIYELEDQKLNEELKMDDDLIESLNEENN